MITGLQHYAGEHATFSGAAETSTFAAAAAAAVSAVKRNRFADRLSELTSTSHKPVGLI